MKLITLLAALVPIVAASAAPKHSILTATTASDPFVVTSNLPDHITKTAMRVTTSQPWFSGGRLLTLENADVPVLGSAAINGCVTVDDANDESFETFWGGSGYKPGYYGEHFFGFTDTAQGKLGMFGIFTGAGDTSTGLFSGAWINGQNDGDARLWLYCSSQIRVQLAPNVANTSTPHILDTTQDHPSGNLLEIKNDGVVKLAVQHDGAIKAGSASTWKFLPASGGQLIVEVDGQKYAITATPIP
jgi:hypothetical protein